MGKGKKKGQKPQEGQAGPGGPGPSQPGSSQPPPAEAGASASRAQQPPKPRAPESPPSGDGGSFPPLGGASERGRGGGKRGGERGGGEPGGYGGGERGGGRGGGEGGGEPGGYGGGKRGRGRGGERGRGRGRGRGERGGGDWGDMPPGFGRGAREGYAGRATSPQETAAPPGRGPRPQEQPQQPPVESLQKMTLQPSPPAAAPPAAAPPPAAPPAAAPPAAAPPAAAPPAAAPPAAARASPSTALVPRGGYQIPTRPSITSAGTKGRSLVVRTNHLALNLKNLRTKIAYHYDIAIDPDKPKRLLRHAVEEFTKRNFPDRYPAFDGRKNLYSASELPIDHKRELRDTVTVLDPEMQKEKEFKITVKYATSVDLTSLLSYMKAGTSLVAPQQAIQVLDVVLRCAPALRFVPVGRSYFAPPSGSIQPLGDGYEIWYGLFQSVNLGWQPFVNVDVVHKGFPQAQRVLDVIEEICGGGRYPLDLSRGLTDYQQIDLKKFLSGLKVDYELPNNPNSKRTYKVNNLVESAAKLKFKLESGQEITVLQYFEREKKIQIRYKNLPCLHVGSPKRPNPIYVPLEFCTVTGGQVVQKKLNERQTANMIKKAATSTQIRESKIRDALVKAQYNTSPQVREFGLQVNEDFHRVNARVLNPPDLEYKNREKLTPRRGVWQAKQFLNGRNLSKWIILVLENRVYDDDIGKFVSQFIQQGRALGMNINSPLPTKKMDSRKMRGELQLFLKSCSKDNCELVVVIVPDRGTEYAFVKQTAELDECVLTQCVKYSTLTRRMNYATAQNILLKVNSKLNGVNHAMHGVSRPKLFSTPFMIVGADVTHPSPDETRIPSVAAVCASHDPNAFQYIPQLRLQPPRMEIIIDLKNIMRQHLIYFYRKTNGQKPQRIFFYRDGVSEGQFQQVLESELTAIRSACTTLEHDYKPAITFLVVQKRHHTRFFPMDQQDSDGKNCNVLPGTIVDTTITHPTERDFYLVSHASIQGVSRPTKYHCLWDDNKLSEDDMEELTYFLCHMFSRCTRSVSYPAPTYYAHLAAYRARVYLTGLLNLDKADERLRTKSLEDLQKALPMYFV